MDEIVTIYRLVYKQDISCGIYFYPFYDSRIISPITTNRHPSPFDDFNMNMVKISKIIGARESYNCIFGFPSREAMNNWFNYDERKKFEENGGRIMVIKILKKHTISSEKQCVFDREKIIKFRVLNLKERN